MCTTTKAADETILSKKQAMPETGVPKNDTTTCNSYGTKDGSDVEEKHENAVMDIDDDEVSCFNKIRHL